MGEEYAYVFNDIGGHMPLPNTVDMKYKELVTLPYNLVPDLTLAWRVFSHKDTLTVALGIRNARSNDTT